MSETERDAAIEVLSRSQFYEVYDPEGVLLEQFFVSASLAGQERLLRQARSWKDQRWKRLTTTLVGQGRWPVTSKAELGVSELLVCMIRVRSGES
jgi:hypothetical protein